MISFSFFPFILLVNLRDVASQASQPCEAGADGSCTVQDNTAVLTEDFLNRIPYYSFSLPGGTSEFISTQHGMFLSPLLDRGINHYLKSYGEYEHPKMRPVLDLIEESNNPIYLDIGARESLYYFILKFESFFYCISIIILSIIHIYRHRRVDDSISAPSWRRGTGFLIRSRTRDVLLPWCECRFERPEQCSNAPRSSG